MALRISSSLRIFYPRSYSHFKYIASYLSSSAAHSQKDLQIQNAQLNNEEEIHKLKIRTPKGTRDFHPHQMLIREHLLSKIINCFKRHGAQALETPVFELKKILTGKCEEAELQLYDLDNYGEFSSLRYDLTVPFARYLAMYKITNLKRYQVGKAYRRDSPMMSRARYREFYQCDFDIAGQYDLMLPDVECAKVMIEVLSDLGIRDFTVKVNHRQLLSGILQECSVSLDNIAQVCSTLDKLDKISWEHVKSELVDTRGLSDEAVSKLGNFVRRKGGKDLIDELLNSNLVNNAAAKEGMEAMKLFLHYCEVYNISDKIILDLSLARGLDYYTGIIYEAIINDAASIQLMDDDDISESDADSDSEKNYESRSIGSVAGGGRYDNLVGTFDRKGNNVPCVGISIGFERIFAIIASQLQDRNAEKKRSETEVYVASAQRSKSMFEHRIKICTDLWNADIKTEYSLKLKPKLLDQLQYCEKSGIPWAVIIGEAELSKGIVKLRHIDSRKEFEVSSSRFIEELKSRLKKEQDLSRSA